MKRIILLITIGLLRERRSDPSPFPTTSPDREGCPAVNTQMAMEWGHIINAGGVLALVMFAFALFILDIPLAAAQNCRWDGTAPFCSGECGTARPRLPG